MLDFLFAQVWKNRLRQRVRPEDRPTKNPWSTLDPHSVIQGTKPFRKGQCTAVEEDFIESRTLLSLPHWYISLLVTVVSAFV